MKLVPLDDKVVLKQKEVEVTTASGIILANTGNKEKPQQAEVIAVGPGTADVKMQVKVGDQIIFTKYAGTNVKVGDEEYIVVKQSDIVAIVED